MLDIIMNNILWIFAGIAIVIGIAIGVSIYRIVPANEAHVVIKRGHKRVFSSNESYSTDGKAAYFKIPKWIPGLGMLVHKMPLKILSIAVPEFLAFDMFRARFVCEIRAFVMIKDPLVAATRFPGTEKTGIDLNELGLQISKIVEATMRDSTTKKNIRDIINNRDDIINYIRKPLTDVIASWGLTLTDIELIDFKDPTKAEFGEKEPPHVIRDISTIEEIKINSEMRRKNAEEIKMARLTEAETEQTARSREIEKEEQIARRDQERNKLVAEQRKTALEKELEVEKTQQVTMQEIEKARSLIEAEQKKQIEEINKKQKQLIGEGDRLMKEEQAKGDAAPILERGLADAAAKLKLQEALNKFGDNAIRAMVAEKIVEMQKEVGIAGAKALENADLKVFAGGGSAEQGFEIGKMVESIRTASNGTAISTLNRLARPNDLGFEELFGGVLGSQVAKKHNEKHEQTTTEGENTSPSKPIIEEEKTYSYKDGPLDQETALERRRRLIRQKQG
jgi:flotillin